MDDDLGSALGPVRGEMARLKEDTDKAREALEVLQDAGEKAGRAIEAGLLRAVRTGTVRLRGSRADCALRHGADRADGT